jgi:hypothetical protein
VLARDLSYSSMSLRVAASLLLTLLGIAAFSSGLKGQQQVPFVAPRGDSGERTRLELEMLAGLARNTSQRVFVISRPGTIDKSQKIAKRRLGFTQMYLHSWPLTNPVFAEGLKVSGEGRIEFYVGSELRLVVLAKPDEVPNLTCCPGYEPPRRKPKSRGKRA